MISSDLAEVVEVERHGPQSSYKEQSPQQPGQPPRRRPDVRRPLHRAVLREAPKDSHNAFLLSPGRVRAGFLAIVPCPPVARVFLEGKDRVSIIMVCPQKPYGLIIKDGAKRE